MAFTKDELVQMALSQLATQTYITNIDTDTSEIGVAAKLAWKFVVPDAISKYGLRFATRRTQLSQLLNIDIPQPWQYAFSIPGDATGILSVWPRGSVYDRYGSIIVSNTNPMWLDYRYIPPVSLWPDHFSTYIVFRLAEFMAPSLSENAALAAAVMKNLAYYEAQCLAADGQQVTATPMQSAPADSVRYSSGNGYGWGWGFDGA